ncbi:hypothetical protein ACFPOU_09525 [Massilia jejuensis]|uniref:Lipoprotein n=1 Tax=Massilia jejuensis TaxID=648894 RepID=A0ABW0PI19_9BURK
MRTTIVLAAALLLSACATPQERAARKQAEMADMIAVYGPACDRLGYAQQSDPWRNCIISLSTKDEMQRYGTHPGYVGPWGPRYWAGGYWGRGW